MPDKKMPDKPLNHLPKNHENQENHEGQSSKADCPRPEWVRGVCPKCGDDLVANCYYMRAKGYAVVHECWSGLQEPPACTYRKVL